VNEATLRLVDTHAHLDEIEAVDEALREAEEAGVVAVIAVGQDYESNSVILELAAKHAGMVYPALGLHPWNLAAMDGGQVERTLHQIESNIETIVAIGEVGLDYHKKVRASVDKDRQQAVFHDVLEVASRHNKAVSIHTRYAWKDGFELVRASGVSKAVFHWYTGFSSVLREILAAGHFISATPAAEYHDEHRRAVREAPL
jgi:TatD DNase family protein